MPPKGNWTEENLMDAWFDVTDNHLSLNEASRRHGVPKGTLFRRMNSQTLAKDESTTNAQRLTPSEETRLETWILRQDQCGHAAPVSIVRGLAASILRRTGNPRPLGKHRIESFKRPHPAIKSIKGRRQEGARFTNFTPKTVK